MVVYIIVFRVAFDKKILDVHNFYADKLLKGKAIY